MMRRIFQQPTKSVWKRRVYQRALAPGLSRGHCVFRPTSPTPRSVLQGTLNRLPGVQITSMSPRNYSSIPDDFISSDHLSAKITRELFAEKFEKFQNLLIHPPAMAAYDRSEEVFTNVGM